MRSFITVTLLIGLACNSLPAQLDSLAEALINSEENISDLNELLPDQPIDINNAERETLENLSFLADTQVTRILDHRPFKSEKELKVLLGNPSFALLRQLLILNPQRKSLSLQSVFRLQTVLEHNRSEANWPFAGNPFESLTRMRFSLQGWLSGGVLMQKDPGEPALNDHLTGYLSWHPPNLPIRIHLGSFTVRWAEGLILAPPYATPKTSFLLKQNKRIGPFSRAFLSSSESGGFLGISAEYVSAKGYNIMTFFSRQLRDGSLTSDHQQVSGLEQSGLHRTSEEMARTWLISELTFGLIMDFPLWIFSDLGFCFIKTRYNPSLDPGSESDMRKTYFRFSGNSLKNISFFYRVARDDFLLSSEFAPSNSLSLAHQHRLHFRRTNWAFLFKWWHIPRDFLSAFGQTMVDAGPTAGGTQGFFCGLSGQTSARVKFSAYYLMAKDLWRGYNDPMPVVTNTFYAQANITLTTGTQLQTRYHISDKDKYLAEFRQSLRHRTHKLRLQIEKRIHTNVRFRTRIEHAFIRQTLHTPSASGISLMQQINWQPFQFLKIITRYSSFHSTNYDARIYEFENNLPGVYSNYPLYGKGHKWFILLTYNPLKFIKIWFRFRWFHLDGESVLGSGPTRINGNIRRDLQFQVDFTY